MANVPVKHMKFAKCPTFFVKIILATNTLLCYDNSTLKNKCFSHEDKRRKEPHRLEQQPKYFIVDSALLPEVFLKVAQVNRCLQSGEIRTVGEATQKVGLSRSAYYKYKDGIKPLFEATTQSIVTFSLIVSDRAGVLSNILSVFARCGTNILTINQSIPINGQAVVTVSARIGSMDRSIEQMMSEILSISGVTNMEILAKE